MSLVREKRSFSLESFSSSISRWLFIILKDKSLDPYYYLDIEEMLIYNEKECKWWERQERLMEKLRFSLTKLIS